MAKKAKRADGRIAMQIYLGTFDGKRKYKTVYGKTQKEAKAKADEIRIRYGKGLDVDAQRDTLHDWAEKWLKVKSTKVSSGRLTTYKCNLKHFESLACMPLCKIRAYDVQEIISELAVYNPNTGKPASKKTLLGIRSSISQVFDMAIANRILDYNPVRAVEISDVQPPKERDALTVEERQWIVDTPHKAQTAAMIMMYAGLRRGELLALQWHDVDLREKTINVNKVVVFEKNKPIVKPTGKTKNSIRIIDMPYILVEYLCVAKISASSIYVCPNSKGQLMTETSWRNMWRSYIGTLNRKYGDFSVLAKQPKSKYSPRSVPIVIRPFTAHWLRHTYATMLYCAGVDVVTAQQQLGHADISTTLNFYTHLDKKFKRKNMTKLDYYIEGKPSVSIKCKSDASQAFLEVQ